MSECRDTEHEPQRKTPQGLCADIEMLWQQNKELKSDLEGHWGGQVKELVHLFKLHVDL